MKNFKDDTSGKILMGDSGAVQIKYSDESFWRLDGPYEGLPVGNITSLQFESPGVKNDHPTFDMTELEGKLLNNGHIEFL